MKEGSSNSTKISKIYYVFTHTQTHVYIIM